MTTVTVRVLDTPIIHNKRYYAKDETFSLPENQAARLNLFVKIIQKDAPKNEIDTAAKTVKKTQKAA